MFSLFSKSASYKTSDKIWMTERESFKGLATDALLAITRNEIPVVVFYFEDVQQRAFDYFKDQNVPFFDWTFNTSGDASAQQKVLFCTQAQELVRLLKSSGLSGQRIQFLFAGHYPLIAPEEALLVELSKQNPTSFHFFLSLDSPLFEMFGAENLRSIMMRLGVKEDECIEHAMVTKSVKRAREKISESVKREIPCKSEKEWFEKNGKR